MISNEISFLLPEIQAYLAGLPVKRAWLLGTCPQGREESGSGIGILFQYAEGEEGAPLAAVSHIAVVLGKLLRRPVDLFEDDCLLPFATGNRCGERILIYEKDMATACRMIGNAFPPPVAMKVGLQIRKVLDYEKCTYSRSKKEVSSRTAV